ncbi:hypothetical protein BTVI_51374 [Pitangus sulphuratus]|nr:hypothetical protein BTVI_51374 [Pitangus sulphuratus]
MDLPLGHPLVKIRLGEEKEELDFLIDTRATFSVLNQELMPKSDKFSQVMGATGQSKKAFLLKPLKFKIGKQMGVHQFLYLPNSPKPLLGRDLLENLASVTEFKQGKIEFKVKEEQLIAALSLAMSYAHPRQDNPNVNQILDEVYPGVWATETPGKSKWTTPIQIELQPGVKPVIRKQYPLRLEDRKGIEPIIENFLK